MSNKDLPAITNSDQAADELHNAWNDMLKMIDEARDAIDDPSLFPPPVNLRNLAEGYRYITGFLYGTIARTMGPTTEYPYFIRMIQPLNRSTIDNSDATYLYAPIDGNYSYTIKGRAADTSHWGGGKAAETGRKAPHYVFMQTASGHSGDTGERLRRDDPKPRLERPARSA